MTMRMLIGSPSYFCSVISPHSQRRKPCLRNGATNSRLGFPMSVNLIKTVPYTQTVGNPSLKCSFSQVVLPYVKVTDKVNHHVGQPGL